MRFREPGLAVGVWCWAAAAAAQVCDSPEHRAFDFLIGSWEIRDAGGALVGTDVVTGEMNGCVIRESYRSVGGTVAESLSVYDPDRGAWLQTWVDNQGRTFQLQGNFADELGMQLTQDHGGRGDRFTWTPVGSDTIHQKWDEVSAPGEPWKTRFEAGWARIPSGRGPVGGGGTPSEGMKPLQGLLGTWLITPIQQDSSGSWVRRPGLPAEFKLALAGKAIVADPTSLLSPGWVSSIETFSWDPFQRVYRLTWHDSLSGLLDVYEGVIEGSTLRFDNLGSGTFWTTPDGTSYAFRLEYDLVATDGVREARVFDSTDGGSTWTLYQRTEYRMVGR